MKLLSDDEKLERARDLWFDLAQATNDADPSHTHGVFVGIEDGSPRARRDAGDQPSLRRPGA